jgi:predicted ATP-dependent Lon-type protease
MERQIFVGSGVEKFGGNLIEISVCLSDLPKEFISEYNGKKYIRLKVQKKREPDQYNKTHSVSVNTYKPEQKPKTNIEQWAAKQENFQKPESETDDLPF